ncbi:unnamed protein product, partial [Iphiclides podalirius]
MSKHELDSDGFRIVTSKRSAKNKQTRVPSKRTQFVKEENYIDVEASYHRILSAAENLKGSLFLSEAIKAE